MRAISVIFTSDSRRERRALWDGSGAYYSQILPERLHAARKKKKRVRARENNAFALCHFPATKSCSANVRHAARSRSFLFLSSLSFIRLGTFSHPTIHEDRNEARRSVRARSLGPDGFFDPSDFARKREKTSLRFVGFLFAACHSSLRKWPAGLRGEGGPAGQDGREEAERGQIGTTRRANEAHSHRRRQGTKAFLGRRARAPVGGH